MRYASILVALFLLVFCGVAPCQDIYVDLESWYQSQDVDASGRFDLADVIYMVNYLFKTGPRPIPTPLVGDLDCSGSLATRDLILHVNWLFRSQWQFLCYGGYLYRDHSGETESDRLAMLLSGQLRAPDSLKARVRSDLDLIRRRYGDSHPGTASVVFCVPWRLGSMLLAPDSSTLEAILVDSYTAWDSLNSEFNFDTYVRLGSWLWMFFNTTANVRAMTALYQQLPGIQRAYVDHWGGDWPTLWPQIAGDTIKYVFRMAWGDCPAGCAFSQYWFFKTVPGWAWPVGFWDEAGGAPAPSWWPEALAVQQNYWRL